MSSWTIWERISTLRDSPLDNPVVMRTVSTSAPPAWMPPSLRRTVPIMMGIAALHALVILFGSGQWGEWFLTVAVILLMLGLTFGPSLLLWALPLGLALGPAIVREREDRTWDLLRITPLDLDTILMGKIEGALWWLRDAITMMRNLALLGGLLVAIFNLANNQGLLAVRYNTGNHFLFWGWLPFSVALFVFDRMQQFALMVVAGLAASAVVRTTRMGLVLGVIATLTVWLAELVLVAVVLAIYPGQTMRYWTIPVLAVIALGPTGGYLLELPLSPLVVAVIGTLVVREIALHLLWRFVVCAAGRCENRA